MHIKRRAHHDVINGPVNSSNRNGRRISPVFLSLVTLLLSACSPTVVVRPTAPQTPGQVGSLGDPVALYIDSAIRQCERTVRTETGDPGIGTVTVVFNLGPALSQIIQDTARSVFPEVVAVDEATCNADAKNLIAVSFACEPYLQAMFGSGGFNTVSGGATAEISLSVIQRRCGDGEVRRAVVVGYGSRENPQAWSNWPDAEDFQPGVEVALADLARNLRRIWVEWAKQEELHAP